MDRKLRMRTLGLVLLTVVSALYLLPSVLPTAQIPSWFTSLFSKKVQLGLDLQGGLHIVYSVDLDKAVDDKAGEIRRDLEAKLGEDATKVDARVETPREPLGAVDIILANPADKSKIDDGYLAEWQDVIERRDCPAERGDGIVCLRVSSDYADQIRESALDQAITTINDRINRYGVAEPSIVRKGDDIAVELPGLDDAEIDRVKSIIDRTAKLEFKLVAEGSAFMNELYRKVTADTEAAGNGITADIDQWTDPSNGRSVTDAFLAAKDRKVFLSREEAEKYGCYRADKEAPGGKYECQISGRRVLEDYLAALGPEGVPDNDHEISFEEITPSGTAVGQVPEKTWRTHYLTRTAELTGSQVAEASSGFEPTTNRPIVLVQFNRAGARRFGDLTTKNAGKKMAIILDNRVTSAPTIDEPILGGSAQIRMGGADPSVAQREVEDLVNVLRTGALPAPLQEMSSSRVGPMLGQDAIDRGVISMVVGAALVVVIMLYFYRFAGVIALVAMVLNVLFQVSVLAALQATLTLPGIAALVLTIGMAVDANIIIYERIREELRAGKGSRGAVDAGFNRAFWTVFDAHVTSLVAGLVLYEYGTGPIQGFAVMLIIGVVANLFTSTWCSRLMFDHYVGKLRTPAQELSI